MLRRGLILTTLCLSSIAALPGAARADEPAAADPAAPDPDAMFKAALKDMTDKKLDRACPAMRESYRLDRRPVVLFYLGQCEDEAGKIATALGVYDEYLALFDKLSPSEQKEEAEREEQATLRREALSRVLPKVTLKLPDDAPAGTKLSRTSRDGVQIPLALNAPLPVDPGEVILRVQAPGRPDWDHRFFIFSGEKKTVEVPLPPADKRTERAARLGKPIEPVPSYLPPLENDSQGQRIAAYVSAGIGVAAIAVGAISGMYTLGQKGTIEGACRGQACNGDGEKAKDEAATFGTLSTVTFAVGGAALATGVILYLTAPAPAKLSGAPSRVVARPSGVEVTWTW
jgi:hypothetical protein